MSEQTPTRVRKFVLSKDVLRSLDDSELEQVAGGSITCPNSFCCTTASQECCSGCVTCDPCGGGGPGGPENQG